MRLTYNYLNVVGLLFVFSTHAQVKHAIIPEPNKINVKEGQFYQLNAAIGFEVPNEYELKEDVFKGLFLFNSHSNNKIIISSSQISSLGEEGYRLSVSKKGVVITSASQKGAFYALRTLQKYIHTQSRNGTIPCVEIIDKPTLQYRGIMLDVSRHFFEVEEVKKIIDVLSYYKYNHFHWHLTDDQGWRIEIKKYPKLTEIGSKRSETIVGHLSDRSVRYDNKSYSGFYTQEQIKEVVQYADERNIVIVPEIEMPGHAQAAIAAYPELSSSGPAIVKREWGISNYLYNTKEETFTFLENVLKEVFLLFPGKYIHIGGDEALKEQWANSALMKKEKERIGIKDEHKLQTYFVQRMANFIIKYGKIPIGWDEVLEEGLSQDVVIMNWRDWGEGEKNGYVKKAAHLGNEVIITRNRFCYFDKYQGDKKTEPLAIGGYIPTDSIFNFDPYENISDQHIKDKILGVQANVWTEYITESKHLEYMIFPRAIAFSEKTWNPESHISSSSWKTKYNKHIPLLEKQHVNFKKIE